MFNTRNNKKHALALALTAVLGTSVLMPDAVAAPGQGNGKANGHVSLSELSAGFIVKFKKSSDVMQAANKGQAHAAEVAAAASRVAREFSQSANFKFKFNRPLAMDGFYVFDAEKRMPPGQAKKLLRILQSHPAVEFVEPNQLLQPLATPNDTRYTEQWHYYEATGGLNAPLAWDNATGSGTVVAVLDTGYRPHNDLVGNILPGYDMISDSFVGNDGDGRDSDARDPGDWTTSGQCGNGYPEQDQDSSWHGTHVAGTIAAVSNNGSGVAGVAYGAQVVPVRVLGRCGGTTADIADGIIWASGGSVSGTASNANPADVINMSLGGQGSCATTTQQAINIARGNGSTVVIASGNSNSDSTNFNPGNCAGVVNVASTDREGGRAYYSNYGSNVDVAAPGGAMSYANDPNGVLSTYNAGATTPGADSYGYSQGTSMAAPHVAGVAALIKQAAPSATPDDVEAILKQTTRSFPGTCSGCGTGIVDAGAAVQQALGGGSGGGSSENELQNGVAETNLSGAQGSEQYFTLQVPAGATELSFAMTGGSGDADLYVRFGSQPTTSTYDCRPFVGGNEETCTISNIQAGTYYVMIQGYSAYSGVSLTGEYTESSGGSGTGGGGTINDLAAATGEWVRYTIDVPAGMSSLDVDISGGTGDADLYVQFGSQPTTSSYDCRPYRTGNTESCSVSNPDAGTYHIGVRAYQSFSGVTLDAYYQP